ncbi:HTH-type transcriptional regulator CdhR (plasmid) [Roseovarius sp. THAF9]|uniref:GlxA family transcriptional regulator n=1 Tax=Roseovarius sp. THAF9 TaxID=2587847 RepID=UPI001268EE36|nr:GlxA family transcriptional regulator [Roseovarius sp. THAF9]QFT95461.1 HTH-type transcriptional regulator CdhR [Roseovarius sp. THAF9]
MTKNWIPRGIAFCEFEQEFQTESFTFVLLPEFSMNAFSSAVEPLRLANQLTGKEIFHWRCVSEDGQPVECSNGVTVGVNGTMEDISATDAVLVCSGVNPEKNASRKVADHIRRLWRQGQTVGGICTGAYTLAQAGILQGSAFTLHWENLLAFQERYPQLEASDQIYTFDRRIWTCAGGSAPTDMMICHIRRCYGSLLAGTISSMCLHDVARHRQQRQKSSLAATFNVKSRKLIEIAEFMETHLDELGSLDDVAYRFGISRRQMERLFRKYMATTPKKFVILSRLYRARSLMSDTNISVTDAAAACGFSSASHFSRRFRDIFGVSPQDYSAS